MSILNTILKTFVGDKSKKDIRAIQHLVDQINKHQLEFEGLSNDELRDKTADFKATIIEKRKSIDQEILIPSSTTETVSIFITMT